MENQSSAMLIYSKETRKIVEVVNIVSMVNAVAMTGDVNFFGDLPQFFQETVTTKWIKIHIVEPYIAQILEHSN